MTEVCENCKREIDFHTQEELLNCKLNIAKKIDSEITEEDITNYFNEIKSGEFSRMSERQKNIKKKGG